VAPSSSMLAFQGVSDNIQLSRRAQRGVAYCATVRPEYVLCRATCSIYISHVAPPMMGTAWDTRGGNGCLLWGAASFGLKGISMLTGQRGVSQTTYWVETQGNQSRPGTVYVATHAGNVTEYTTHQTSQMTRKGNNTLQHQP
jgi:hypothetical protein